MRNINYQLVSIWIAFLTLPLFTLAQDVESFDLGFEINRVSPILTVDKYKLEGATNLIELNERFESDWIKEYISVETSLVTNGVATIIGTIDDKITKEQKSLMLSADPATDIAIKVRYIPDNNLSDNDIQELRFVFNVDPEREANYKGGLAALNAYLQSEVIDKVSASDFNIYNLTAIKFTINEDGEVVDAKVEESSKDKEVDALLVNAIAGMPAWNSARYDGGTTVSRDFVFTVGDHRSCVINLLDIVEIHKYRREE